MSIALQKIARELELASGLFLKGKATPAQYVSYIAKRVKLAFREVPAANPAYQRISNDPTDDPEAMAKLDQIGFAEVPDEDMNAMAKNESPEDIDFDGGGLEADL